MSGREPLLCAVSVVVEMDVTKEGWKLRHWLGFVTASSREDAERQGRAEYATKFEDGGEIISVLIDPVRS